MHLNQYCARCGLWPDVTYTAVPQMSDKTNTEPAPGDALTTAADEVIDAMLDPGSHPDYHYQQMTRLKEEWPTLYEAIAVLIQARGRQIPLRVHRGGLSQMPPDLERKLRDSL
jgi:hypothetical protein